MSFTNSSAFCFCFFGSCNYLHDPLCVTFLTAMRCSFDWAKNTLRSWSDYNHAFWAPFTQLFRGVRCGSLNATTATTTMAMNASTFTWTVCGFFVLFYNSHYYFHIFVRCTRLVDLLRFFIVVVVVVFVMLNLWLAVCHCHRKRVHVIYALAYNKNKIAKHSNSK